MPMELAGQARDVGVEERGAGQTVGWSGLIPPHRFTLEAIAVVDSTVLVLPRTVVLRHFESRPAIGWAVTENLASIVGQRLQVIQAMWLREVQRVVQLRYA
jgi:CRP-like cAMP-binding protein